MCHPGCRSSRSWHESARATRTGAGASGPDEATDEDIAALLTAVGPAVIVDNSLAAVADRLGVRVPSLDKRVDGITALTRGAMLAAKTGLGGALSRAAVGRSHDEAIVAISTAYRAWPHSGLAALGPGRTRGWPGSRAGPRSQGWRERGCRV